MLNSKSFYFLISRQHMEFQSFLVATFVIILYRELESPLFPLLQQKPSLLFLSLSLPCKQTHTHSDLPLGLPPSHAICQRGRVSIGGSFITALLTPRGDRCSWRPAELSMCVCVLGGDDKGEGLHFPAATCDPQHVKTSCMGTVSCGSFHFQKE